MKDEGPGRLSRLMALPLIGLVRIYRYSLSSLMGRTCRYLPTCSEYTEEALRRHGGWAGGWIGLARIC
ncbi:MAG TPA: membrane protein insertion efficiency factor YidD, partial [Beijerinckiaceae bacterium]|nr:membrane protein insertion efficiency factor YidD [Beijerinckiaceae bacterium]